MTSAGEKEEEVMLRYYDIFVLMTIISLERSRYFLIVRVLGGPFHRKIF